MEIEPAPDSARTDRLALLMAIAFSVLPVLGQFAVALDSLDEALLLVYPEQVLAGRMPQSDYFTVYGPGGFGFLAAVYSLTGPTVLAERAVGLMYHVAIATGVVRLTRPCGRTASLVAGVTSAIVLLPLGLPAYAWLGGLALAVWSVALLTQPGGPRWVFFAGILGGLVPAWRIEMLVLLAAAGPLVWRTRLARPYLTGLAVGLTPIAAFLLLWGPEILENVFLGRVAVNSQLELDTVPLPVWAGIAISIVITGALIVAACHRSPRQRTTMAYAVFAALLLPQELQRIDLIHVSFALCVIAPLGVARLLWSTTKVDSTKAPVSPKYVALVIFTLLSLSALSVARNPTASELTHNGRHLPVSAAEAKRIEAQLEVITETIPVGSRIFVGASDMSVPTLSDMYLYHLLPEYRADSYYLELPPGVAEKRGSRLLDDVLGADALILTDIPAWLRESLFPHMGGGDDIVNQAVKSHFCPVRRAMDTTVYLRCDAG